MVRGYMAFLGVGLLLLWIAFLTTPVSPWVHWVDFTVGLGCLATAGLVSAQTPRSVRTVIPLAAALFLLVVAVMSKTAGAQSWWNVAFSALLILAGLAEASNFTDRKFLGHALRPFYGMGYYGEIGFHWRRDGNPRKN